ncbi:DNA polymerase interacting tetratricopeptide repeat-containing, protein of 47 kDa isoform X2 [Dendroctonus ponderosae]|uniref:Cns1/TTC4 wheel domain-containing protein n=1 Tax=Dendroctonus ponderosae TaxID=77166 RepID=A0AAR5P216_DENPD|nr:DNA polymerase interacting tetratricopeptide repeat-containing, protein of 47 kDa isoform X2 [Dendroctonus ponderosae]KAH1011063.1 hypothetical protein HUJ04_000507 [Dendroctonus ponderosae]KAH1011064.1 hypothetical protein HUJ04_000507 [Dendroctonus ponderosae]KAH1019022.1 hypothetical protein HUJ05_006687 [Dendroctonus ponderosae]
MTTKKNKIEMEPEINPSAKQPMTDEERLKLAKKLDDELDEYINSLPKTKYEDGWPEDRWEEEMDKHPFFMKEAPKLGDELHPLYEGLQKLKYDPDENEPQELAISYKDDGNFNFKHKNYRLAIVAYTEGIKQKCGDSEIDSSLLNNRAAAHWFLQNYRSCLRDCELALKIKPNYEKVLNRAANCCYHLARYDKGIEYCDNILESDKTNKDILNLRKKCVNALKLKERNDRKRDADNKKANQSVKDLIAEIVSRGYKIEGGGKDNIDLSKLEPCFPELANQRVYLNRETNCLVWPVVLVYPEYKIMDYIKEFADEDSFIEQLHIVFETYPEWDRAKAYRPDNVNIYFETINQNIVKVDNEKTLGYVLKTQGYVIKGGTPNFIVLVKNSDAEKAFLRR